MKIWQNNFFNLLFLKVSPFQITIIFFEVIIILILTIFISFIILKTKKNASTLKKDLLNDEISIQYIDNEIENINQNNEIINDETEDVFIKNLAKIRYKKSFTAKLILADNEVKNNYNIIKNYILMHLGIKCKMSFNFETFSLNKKQLIKLRINGKTLVMYIALDPNIFIDTKYHGVDASDKMKYINVPFLYKLNGNRKIKYAKELIDMLHLEKSAKFDSDYKIDFETDTIDNLINKKLIKVKKFN